MHPHSVQAALAHNKDRTRQDSGQELIGIQGQGEPYSYIHTIYKTFVLREIFCHIERLSSLHPTISEVIRNATRSLPAKYKKFKPRPQYGTLIIPRAQMHYKNNTQYPITISYTRNVKMSKQSLNIPENIKNNNHTMPINY